MTCISPIPPSHATMLDCQPLSCHAVALTSSTGTRMLGADTGQ